jgi:hypothetical protein
MLQMDYQDLHKDLQAILLRRMAQVDSKDYRRPRRDFASV